MNLNLKNRLTGTRAQLRAQELHFAMRILREKRNQPSK
jgi:hypothetical protein